MPDVFMQNSCCPRLVPGKALYSRGQVTRIEAEPAVNGFSFGIIHLFIIEISEQMPDLLRPGD